MKILIADDSSIMRKIIKANLLKYNNTLVIYESSNGKDALKFLLQNDDIDILFLDLKMPKITGFDVSNYIKEKNIQGIKIIAISSELSEENLKIFKSLGVTDFLSKPFDLGKFNLTIAPIFESLKLKKR